MGTVEISAGVDVLPHDAQLKAVQLALTWIELAPLVIPDNLEGAEEVLYLQWKGEL